MKPTFGTPPPPKWPKCNDAFFFVEIGRKLKKKTSFFLIFRNFYFLGVFFKFYVFEFFFCISQLISLYQKDRLREKEPKMQSDFFLKF